MHPQASRLVIDGAIGGFLAGLFVAVWYLVSDLFGAGALSTPLALAEATLGHNIAQPTVLLVAGYTMLHFGVFVALGMVASLALSSVGIEPQLRHGLVFGLGVLNAVHYGSMLLTGGAPLGALPGFEVFVVNLCAGFVLMYYLHRAQAAQLPFGLGNLREHPLLAQTLGIGALGALVVAVWFLLLDVLAGRPLYTPAALGSVMFAGATEPGQVQVTPGIIMAYTLLHALIFSLAGLAMAWAAEQLERAPGYWLLAVMVFIVFEAGFLGIAGGMGDWVLGTLGWWSILVGNLLAATAMGAAVWRLHPGLKEGLIAGPASTMV